jgi:hypothetical protein
MKMVYVIIWAIFFALVLMAQWSKKYEDKFDGENTFIESKITND